MQSFFKGELNLNNKTNLFIKETVHTVTSVLPLALSMSVCAGMGAFSGAVFACIAALICGTVEEKKQMPAYASFLIVTYAFKEFGSSTVSLSILICGILLIISALFYNKAKEKLDDIPNNPVTGTVMLLCALTVTILFTTDYFGIGATGNTVKDIIASYISLGFHPNWRGVLYGTIVMVVMITFPRKFKKANKIINAAFIALIITTLLNLFLNPSDMITSINEVGTISFSEYKNNILLSAFKSNQSLLYAFVCGISLYLTCFYMLLQNESCQKSDFIFGGIANCAAGFITCMSVPNITKKSRFSNGVIASLLTGIIFFVLHDFIERIPVHSCAVILIVGVWQSIKWSEVKKVFSSALNIIIFAVIIILGLVKSFAFVPVYALAALLFYSYKAKPSTKNI